MFSLRLKEISILFYFEVFSQVKIFVQNADNVQIILSKHYKGPIYTGSKIFDQNQESGSMNM